MSFSRLALRLAAIEALAPAAIAATGPWPTIAGPRVYDSRIDPVAAAVDEAQWEAALAAMENKPLISVYTEDDHSAPYGSQKVWPNRQTVTLVLELMIAARGEVQVAAQDAQGNPTTQTVGTLEAAITDRQHEALLDILEGQALAVLNLTAAAPSAMLYRQVAIECNEITSDPQRIGERALRLAMRTIKLHLHVKKEAWGAPGALPAPLSLVAAGLPAASSGAQACALATAALQAPAAAVKPDLAIDIFAGLHGVEPTNPDGSDSDYRGLVGSATQV